jgi:hypothetical protein
MALSIFIENPPRIKSVNDFLQYLPLKENSPAFVTAYRGQTSDEYLQPKLFRSTKIPTQVSTTKLDIVKAKEERLLREFERQSHPFLTRVPRN